MNQFHFTVAIANCLQQWTSFVVLPSLDQVVPTKQGILLKMREPPGLFLLLCICSCGANATLELFIEDLIVTWKLLSPTIVVDENLLQLCRTRPWVLCLSSDMDDKELAKHLEVMYRERKQDAIIFADEGQKEILQQLDILVPAIFRSNYPIFLPIGHSEDLNLRLDSRGSHRGL